MAATGTATRSDGGEGLTLERAALPAVDLDARAVPSPFRDLIGVRIVEWREGRCVVEVPIRPDLKNFAGVVAGPVVAAAIDMSATLAGCYTPPSSEPRRAVTVSLTVAFVASAEEGSVRAVATKVGGGRTIYTSTVEVLSADDRVLATGQCTCRYIT